MRSFFFFPHQNWDAFTRGPKSDTSVKLKAQIQPDTSFYPFYVLSTAKTVNNVPVIHTRAA